VNAILVAIERASAAAGSRSSGGGGVAANGTGAQPQQQQQQELESPGKQQQRPHDITFEVADMLTRDFTEGSFDVCISRDSLLHVEDKQALFARWVLGLL